MGTVLSRIRHHKPRHVHRDVVVPVHAADGCKTSSSSSLLPSLRCVLLCEGLETDVLGVATKARVENVPIAEVVRSVTEEERVRERG
jgi:hypothetical protein